MDLEARQRREQIFQQIQAACEEFHTKYNPLSVSDAVIELFLEETSHIELEPENKLIFFADLERLGWEGVSKVHRYVIDRETEGGVTYGMWINEGLALMGDKSQEFEYRKHIAEDVEKLIAEASKGDDEWAARAGLWTSFYLNHPLRDDKEPNWLTQATKWCELSVESLRSSNELGSHELCELADLYRQLGRLDDAARLYTEALSGDLPECCENSSARSIQERLTMCSRTSTER